MALIAKKPIYVEILIQGSMEGVWEKTQNPSLHEQWDVRFTSIRYLPRSSESEPQRFVYSTRIGFGISISGEGETVGEKSADGSRTSALRFWSANPISLIRGGSGYWKYEQQGDGAIRFLTWYDYETRFGVIGQVIDRAVFRPLMGWGTAWGFDNLRLWIEQGIDPRMQRLRMMVDAVCRAGLAGAWIYQGLVPKLLAPDTGEVDILIGAGLSRGGASVAITFVGVAQILFGLLFLTSFFRASLHRVSIAALFVLGIGGMFSSPRIFVQPFNPASLTIAMAALSVAGLCALAGPEMPRASRCKRTKD